MAVWILGAVFSVAGLPMVWLSVRAFRRDRAIARWPTAPGVVISSSIDTRRDHSRDKQGLSYSYDSYAPVVRYTYRVAGQVLEGDQVTREYGWTTSLEPVQACINKYPPGKEVAVLYDPSDPKTAYLETQRSLGAMILFAFGRFWIALGTLLFVLELRT